MLINLPDAQTSSKQPSSLKQARDNALNAWARHLEPPGLSIIEKRAWELEHTGLRLFVMAAQLRLDEANNGAALALVLANDSQ